MTDPSLEPLAARYREFKTRTFPTDWATVVNGVGLASLATRAERCMDDVVWKHLPRSTVDELLRLLAMCERALPALPPEPHDYFDELRSIVLDALHWAKRHRPWHFQDIPTVP
jgi:hypothetical protein